MNQVPVCDAIADRQRGVCIRGPDRGGQTERGVVHQRDRFLVRVNPHDARDRAEDFLAHDRHRVIDIEQHLRRQIGCAAGAQRKFRFLDDGRRAGADRCGNLAANRFRRGRAHDGAERCLRIERIAEHILAREVDEAIDEGVVDAARARRCAAGRSTTDRC